MNVTSDEALQVLSAAHELGRAGRRELHAGLAECGLGREVVLRRGLKGQNALAALHAGSSETAAHMTQGSAAPGE